MYSVLWHIMKKLNHYFIFGYIFRMYDLWKRYVYRTTFSNVEYQDLSATINPSKIKYLQNRKQSLKYLCINLIGFLQKPDFKLFTQILR